MDTVAPTVVVIDDSAEVRSLIRTRLRLSGRITVVADGANGTEAIGLAFRHQPSLLLLDMSMPTMDGLDALPGVLAVSPDTRVVVYTGFEEHGLAELARELGATAFIEKSSPIDTLADQLLAALHAEPGHPSRDRSPAVPDPDAFRNPGSDDQHVLDEHVEGFREVFEEAAIGMATMTLSGGIVRANRALGVLMNRTRESLVGTDYATLTGDKGEVLAAALGDINERFHDLVHIEHDVAEAPAPRRVSATLAPVRDSKGQALYVFLQVQDVTAQRAAEDDLRRSEERFRLLVEGVEDYAIFMLDPGGIVVSWNAGAERSKGYRAHEIIGRHFRTFYRPAQQRARHPEFELEAALRDGHYTEEGWRVRKDGSEFWANVLITAVYDDAGRHVGFAKVTRDVTADQESDERLRQSEERFRLLVDAVRDYAIFMLDPQGRVMSWNAGAKRTKGYTAAEVIGQHFRIFYPDDQQDEGHPERELEIALREGRYEEEGWRIRKDGTRFWANVVITAVFNDLGEHIGFAKVTRDTSRQRDTAQDREHAAAALEDANASLESVNTRLRRAAEDQAQFLAVTAHELRTPVSVLGGSANTLARHWAELADDERVGLLNGMVASGERLRHLLDDLLTAARLDANALRLRVAPTPLAEVVSAAAKAVHAGDPDAQVLVETGPDVHVLADRGRLAQAVDNLVGNALRHGEPPVRIEVDAVDDMGMVRVSDSGPGVDPDVRSRLFQRFTTGDEVNGTGLGLYIVRELARAHGGDAVYEPGSDDYPAGSFVVSVPLA
jgi:PAS domain S-box-containing protein